MKYSPEGATIEAGVYRRAGEILIMIRDSGIGISEEDQKRIFDRFYRVDKARSRAMGGTGLGLSIAKEIMELHGGRIWVNSEPGQGSEFWLAFPEQLAVVERGMLP
jgi:two-component system sensor histidine kinase VicK